MAVGIFDSVSKVTVDAYWGKKTRALPHSHACNAVQDMDKLEYYYELHGSSSWYLLIR